MNINALDMNLLVAFEAILIEKSVSRAADRVGLSQPGMSNALARLRNVFNDRLFVRNGKRLAPTAKAVALAAPIGEALALIRAAINDPREFEPSKARTRFRILSPDYCDLAVVAPFVRRLRSHAPGVSIQIRRPSALFGMPHDELASDLADIAIGFFSEVLPPGSSLVQATLRQERLVGLATCGRFRSHAIRLKEFLRAPQVRVSLAGDSFGLVDELLARQAHKRETSVSSAGFLSVPSLVAGTDLLGIIPEAMAATIPSSLNLRTYRLPDIVPALRLSIIWHERNHVHPGHQWLRRQLLESVQLAPVA